MSLMFFCLHGNTIVSVPVPVYDIIGSMSDRNVVVLNNIHIDIMDYIQPASCTDSEFRKMWAEFEWENKVCTYVCERERTGHRREGGRRRERGCVCNGGIYVPYRSQ